MKLIADKYNRPAVIFLFLHSLIYQQPACGRELITLSGPTMGTSYTIKIYPSNKALDGKILNARIERLLEKINLQMSTYIDNSDISLFNQHTSDGWLDIDKNVYTVIKEALRVNHLSGGAFDITIGPVVNLWGFGPEYKSRGIPDELTIQQELDKIGSRHIELRAQPYAIKKNKLPLAVDLSAIAKGFAVDAIAGHLDTLGLHNYMVEIGGEIKAKGAKDNGKSWRIGIERPLYGKQAVQTVIALDNIAMATSGDYRNYFEADGSRYSHIIDPRTGRPVKHQLASVTVLHRLAMTADALATALLVLGPGEGMQLAGQENIAALFIVRKKNDFTEIMTPQFQSYLLTLR